MAKYRFRFPFHVPSSTRLTGDPFELDYTWKSHPVHILVKGYGSSSGSDNRSYDCCGREFDTPQEALECAADAERRLTRAALSLGLGINLWTDREPRHQGVRHGTDTVRQDVGTDGCVRRNKETPLGHPCEAGPDEPAP